MREKILLVDDEPEIRELLADFLEDEGYQIQQAEDGVEAFKLFQSQEFDLVITDVRMPNRNGIALLKDIKDSGNEVDVIILTGQSDELTAIDCLRAGAYDYLLKPIEDLDIILSSINRAMQKRNLEKKNQSLMDQLEDLAVRDPLTGLYNMRPFYQFINSEIARSKAHSQEFGVLFIDIDHFKKVNDNYGHQFGDQVLKEFANLLCSEIKGSDKIFRYGGEEFVIISPETNYSETIKVAKKLLEITRKYEFIYHDQSTYITISIGGAVYPVDSLEQIDLIKMADDALYKAKHSGRDCFVAANTDIIY